MTDFREVQKTKLQTLHQFLPAWETLWAKIWSAFDEMESRRKVAHRRPARAQAPS